MTERIAKSQVLDLFPTRVWAVQLQENCFDPINADICRLLDRIGSSKPELESAGQWQTDQNLHESAELGGLLDVIGEVARDVCDAQTVIYDDIAVTGCWANISRRGHSHPAHYHPNNFLSGSYYVNVSPGSNAIRFYDPRPQCNLIVPPVRDPSRSNPQQLSLSVNTGSLVLFPAWLAHSVDPNSSDQTRISIAFNLMFPTFGSTMAGPNC